MIKVNKISEKVYQLRIIDTEEKQFHGTLFPVIDGVSYASYLILDEEVTLVDTFEIKYHEQMMQEINTLLAGRTIDHVIINHVEPDHSQSFQLVMDAFPQAKPYCSKGAVKEMQQNFFFDVEYTAVGYGDEIKTGAYTLKFLETPLVHWPDNMWTYLAEEEILFSNDAFGQLITDDVYSDKELGKEKLLKYAREYYTNIVFPNNAAVLRLFNKFKDINWPVKLVAPGHGIMLEEYFEDMCQLYTDLANETKEEKAIIVFETIWGNTMAEALAIKEDFKAKGIETKLYQLSNSRISEVIDEVATAKYIVIGTGNQNNCMFPIVADFIERLKALKAMKAKVLIFGAYGWSPAPFMEVAKRLRDAKYDVYPKPVTINFKLTDDKKIGITQEVENFMNYDHEE